VKASIRVAVGSDVAFLTEVVLSATRSQGRLPPGFDELAFRERYAAWTAEHVADLDGPSTTYVIEVDGRPAGRLRVVRTPEQLELAGIQLLPGFQSRGLGTAVITGLLREAVAAGRPMTLSVEKDNPRALALYRRLGFAVTGEDDKEFAMRTDPPAGEPDRG
jgi:ribosomal protein S18 acetylase RimI-like enzyme